MKARFRCDNCGRHVPLNHDRCPHCGRKFTSVICPVCSFEGDSSLFHDGCPNCGYQGSGGSKQRPSGPARKKSSAGPYALIGMLLLAAVVLLAAFFLGR